MSKICVTDVIKVREKERLGTDNFVLRGGGGGEGLRKPVA